MKITEENIEATTEILEIKTANYLGDFAVRVLFSNGFSRLVDFKPFLELSLHPSIRKYLDEKMFKDFQIIDGNLNWNDYDLIFPIIDLYEGRI